MQRTAQALMKKSKLLFTFTSVVLREMNILHVKTNKPIVQAKAHASVVMKKTNTRQTKKLFFNRYEKPSMRKKKRLKFRFIEIKSTFLPAHEFLKHPEAANPNRDAAKLAAGFAVGLYTKCERTRCIFKIN